MNTEIYEEHIHFWVRCADLSVDKIQYVHRDIVIPNS